ncbi:FG-GAP-like repeat-containing protein [Desulfolithobacter sp.]
MSLSIFRYATLLFLFLLLPTTMVRGQADPGEKQVETKVIFLPFSIEIQGPYDYLSDGLASILASRLASRAPIIALHKTSETRKLIRNLQSGKQQPVRNILKAQGADYLVLGNVTAHREEGTTRISVFVFNGENSQPRIFTRPIADISDAVQAVDELAWDIAADVFSVPKPQSTAATTEGRQDGLAGFETAHPERAFKEGIYQDTGSGLAGAKNFSLLMARKSRELDLDPVDMDVADLDGDGHEEIVLATRQALHIYQYVDEHFSKKSVINLADYIAIHAINIADLDGNGRREIYVSASNSMEPASAIIEWNGKEASFIRQNVPWYLRPSVDPTRKQILLGQKSGLNSPVGETIYELAYGPGNNLQPVQQISIPPGYTLFDFALVDLDQDGTQEIIGLDRRNKMHVFDRQGVELWKSGASYGASKNYYGTRSISSETMFKIHTRITARDMNGDGRPDLIIGRNRLTHVPYLKKMQYFEGSSIAGLSWKDGRMYILWETGKLPGYTAGYQVVPAGNLTEDGRIRLYFSQSPESYPMFFFGSKACTIHLYELGKKTTR